MKTYKTKELKSAKDLPQLKTEEMLSIRGGGYNEPSGMETKDQFELG